MPAKLAVVAIGGNSLIQDKAHQSIPDQMVAADETCKHIVELVEAGWKVVVTHGNGPQVGFIQRRSELAEHELHEVPLHYCGADTQGAIGYMIQQSLNNYFRRHGLDRHAVTVVTQVLVDGKDPAFAKPSKPIGSFMDAETAKKRADEDGWDVVEDAGRGWRRVVASPRPVEILEFEAVRALIDADFIVTAVGGGGIPVVRDEKGDLTGVEAVIDKDYASALLANELGADLFAISTAVEKVSLNFGKPEQVDLDRVTASEARRYLEEGHFPGGSMEPKVKAILEFLDNGGTHAVVTEPHKLREALAGETGTHFIPDPA